MHIILDAMGSDRRPEPEIRAAVRAARAFDLQITLVGPEDVILPRLRAANQDRLPVSVVHAPEVLEMTDKPAENARRKAQNSMAVGMNLIKSGQGDAFVTAGNTGGAMANALLNLGRVSGVKRPALTAVFPVWGGECVVLDIGANTETKPMYLLQFAIMGAVYAEKVLGVEHPRVGLLSNGEEPGKGNQLVQETYPLLETSGLNFIGNVEGKELFGGEVDVVVTDGFTGNILLKTSEAVAKFLVDLLRRELRASLQTKMGALLARAAFKNLKKRLDPAEVGAAPLLGVNGLVFIGHGRSDERALFNALRVTRQAVAARLLESVRISISEQLRSIDAKEIA